LKKQSTFDKLNLKPGERRLVIGVIIAVFIILNWLFVWPKFSEWGKIKARRQVAQAQIDQYDREIRNTKTYQLELAKLKEQGAEVATEEQAVKLSTTVNNQAALSGVGVNRYDPQRPTSALSSAGKTNQFFEEQSGVVNVTTEEKNLVDFLYHLGVGGSMIRVRSMTLNPDPQRQKLQGNITLVATYQKKAPPRAVAATTTPARPAPTSSGAKPSSPFSRTNAPVRTNQPAKK
jgi:hypothetical protein